MGQSKSSYRLSYIDLGHGQERPLAEPDESTTSLQRHTQQFWGFIWILEIVACLVSIALLAAIIGFLSHYDGQSLPEWPYAITLNALVSVLSTAMKAAIAFIATQCLAQLKWLWFRQKNRLSDLTLLDDASRGPVGAFKVLYSFLPRHLVTFGCVILVLAVATDPFVQQVISIQMRSADSPSPSSIRVCNNSLYGDYGLGAGPGMNKLPLTSMGAVYSGIFKTENSGNKSSLVSCTTGNCTFPIYQTLGVCSQCANITNALQASGTGPDEVFNLPNGLTLSPFSVIMNSTTQLDMLQIDTTDTALILNFTAIAGVGSSDPSATSAIECTLSFCIKTYEASVHDGIFKETLVNTDTRADKVSANSPVSDFALTPATCYSDGIRYDRPLDRPGQCTYQVSSMSIMALSNTLGPLLQGHGTLFANYRLQWTPDTLQPLYGTEGSVTEIGSAFASIESSLSVNARSQVCKSTVQGTTKTISAYVQVRWVWLILPGALVVFSLLFLVTTMVRTRNQHVWKSSPLVLLFSDLTVDSLTPWERSGPTLKEMESESKRMNFWLEHAPDGVKFRAEPK
ncbi:hypothetical protein N7539_003631 [Penicillium diatomitis]|uniref:Uncharacterized protein n=1 Tax=Penicillium diatomitis TaxID=2819901 RepID=A0A9X0BXF2_9EURO|nr:uncharacterized protein N7539_003631 [Penicillium diatomitis]KAJ5488741.1 hypothetical protein N7539_003631 [Penicillium diatomitis]